MQESSRRRLHEQAESSYREIDDLAHRRDRLLRELETVDLKLEALRADLGRTLDRLYGLRGMPSTPARPAPVVPTPPTRHEAQTEADEPVIADEVVVEPESVQAAAPARREAPEAESDPEAMPRGLFDRPTSEWTDEQLGWLVMTPTVRKQWRGVCAIRAALKRLGGAATKNQLAGDLHEHGHAYTSDQVSDLLASSYFRLGEDHMWRAVATGPVLTPARRKIAERWFAIIQIIEEHGGRARWKEIQNGLYEKVGVEATRNRVNHALRDGPFEQDSLDKRYRFVPTAIQVAV